MESKVLNRRSVLTVLIYLAVSTLMRPVKSLATLINGKQDNSLIEKLDSFYTHKQSARVIGQEYLRLVPQEANVQCLVALIFSGTPFGKEKRLNGDIPAIRKSLQLQQRQDFQEGHIVRIHGWVLSLTEARLCGISAIRES